MSSSSFSVPNVVLLAAGSGRRMLPLTARAPKALLPVAGRTVIDWMIAAVQARCDADIVVVTGFAADAVQAHLAREHGPHVRTAHNRRYAQDTNILSVEIGVAALTHPERGYLVCETDLLLDDDAWDRLFAGLDRQRSQWICRGRYGPALTGGAVRTDGQGRVDAIAYAPRHDPQHDGWHKMLGLLWVAPAQVVADRHARQSAIDHTIDQYYLMPWQKHRQALPCGALQVASGLAATFNTPAEYSEAAARFDAAMRKTFSPTSSEPVMSEEATPEIHFVPVERLRHIEGFSRRRVEWLTQKMLKEGLWTKPVAVDDAHDLVLDGQHRMEAAKRLGLKRVPAVRFHYADVEVWSLRPKHQFDWQRVTERALADEPYPYKTVKHRFPGEGLPQIAVPLSELA